MALPKTPLPASLAARALPLLLSQLAKNLHAPPSAACFPQLSLALLLLAQDELAALPAPSNPAENYLVPLHLLLHLAPSVDLEWDMIVSATIAFGSYAASIKTVIEGMLSQTGEDKLKTASGKTIDDLLRPSTLRAPNQLARILLVCARAHPILASQLLNHGDFLSSLLRLYRELSPSSTESSVQAKTDLLVLFDTIMQAEQAHVGKLMKRKAVETLQEEATPAEADGDAEALLDAAFWTDYQLLFASSVQDVTGHSNKGTQLRVGERQLAMLRSLREKSQGEDPRLAILTSLFPTIPLSLLRAGLSHPQFALPSSTSSKTAPETLAAPFIESILSGGSDLPAELGELRRVAARTVGVDVPQKKRVVRDNAFDDDLDLSKLRLKGVEDDFIGSGMPKLRAEIPDHLRASILRLAQSQKVEEEEEARALREASYGFSSSSAGPSTERIKAPRSRTKPFDENDHRDLDDDETDDDNVRRIRIRGDGDGDASDQGAPTDASDSDGAPSGPVKKLPREASRPSQAALQQQTTLELAYLRDAHIFDRDSETKRSKARAQLREATGMDDGQLEGWRLMLERNPHKGAILSKHQWDPRMNKQPMSVERERDENADRDFPPHLERGSNGTGRGRGGSDAGRGRGSSDAGRGRGGSSAGGSDAGRGGRGGGRGARGQSKGSRGHSNAARTRGHDRKMAKMGSGL